jgi:hypothetical protein
MQHITELLIPTEIVLESLAGPGKGGVGIKYPPVMSTGMRYPIVPPFSD